MPSSQDEVTVGMTGVLIRRGQCGHRHTERTSCGDGGRVGVMLLHEGVLTPTRDFQRVREPLLSKLQKGFRPAYTLILNFQSPEL